MLIAVGVQHEKEIAPLVKAGAGEFFAGIVPDSWSKTYGYSISPNRREYKRPNLESFESLKALIDEVAQHGKTIYLTLNAHEYSAQLLPQVLDILQRSLELGIHGIIVADPGLLLTLKEVDLNIPLILSGDFGFTNSRSLDWIRDTGMVSRIIFPRHTTLSQMEKVMARHPQFETETFLMNERCFFSGAHCLSVHGLSDKNFCSTLFDQTWRLEAGENFGFDFYQRAMDTIYKIKQREQDGMIYQISDSRGFPAIPCGLCRVRRFKIMNITAVKIVGRGVDLEWKKDMVKITRQVMDEDPDPEEIKTLFASRFGNYFREMCDLRLGCYHMEEQ